MLNICGKNVKNTDISNDSENDCEDEDDNNSITDNNNHNTSHYITVQAYERLTKYILDHLCVIKCEEQYYNAHFIESSKEIYQQLYNHHYIYNESSYIPTSGRFSLSIIEDYRNSLNYHELVIYATYLLQRVFRGFRGRAKYRRIYWKRIEYLRQFHETNRILKSFQQLQIEKGRIIIKIQQYYRGYRWRKMLYIMNTCVLIIQCRYRQYRAILYVIAEKKRIAEGVPVFKMLG